jgi:cytochrome c oxidase subunit 2
MWKLQHSNGRREINELHVPAGEAVKLTLTSQDVVHSFFVPAFRVKQDAVPGQYRVLWFEATVPGEYHLFCAEYCGTNHSRMTGRVIVMTSQDYQQWLAGSSEASPAEAGRELFAQLDCGSCHESGKRTSAPTLGARYGTEVPLANGSTVLFDEAYVRESLIEPFAKISRGFSPVMPSYQGQVTEEQILALIEYLKSIGSAPSGQNTGAER